MGRQRLVMRIATWNVNGVRARWESLVRFVGCWQPDVLCLQETKVDDEQFPAEPIRELGYPFQVIHGEKGRHGVATVSKLPLERVQTLHWCGRHDARHILAMLPCGLEVHNFYVPKGGHEPDPEASPSFAHKLAFLGEMAAWFAARRRPGDARMLVGDLNVAPLETDVWNHRRLRRSVGHTPVEVEHLGAVQASLGWIDAERRFVPPDRPLYTWWGYRVPGAFEKGYGWRLDHVWVTPPVMDRVDRIEVIYDPRTWERPSDHVPVLADLAAPASL
jgi:exodeoxyribonuclease-3